MGAINPARPAPASLYALDGQAVHWAAPAVLCPVAVPPGVATEVAPAQPVAEAATAVAEAATAVAEAAMAVVEVKRAVPVVAVAQPEAATVASFVKRAVLEMALVQPAGATGHLRCGHDARWSEI